MVTQNAGFKLHHLIDAFTGVGTVTDNIAQTNNLLTATLPRIG
jgi:hypothetical protein